MLPWFHWFAPDLAVSYPIRFFFWLKGAVLKIASGIEHGMESPVALNPAVQALPCACSSCSPPKEGAEPARALWAALLVCSSGTQPCTQRCWFWHRQCPLSLADGCSRVGRTQRWGQGCRWPRRDVHVVLLYLRMLRKGLLWAREGEKREEHR